MNNVIAMDITFGALAMAFAILYAAWHEYKTSNRRDAKLLVTVGSLARFGSAVAWVQ